MDLCLMMVPERALIARILSEYKSHFPAVKKKKSVNIEDAVE